MFTKRFYVLLPGLMVGMGVLAAVLILPALLAAPIHAQAALPTLTPSPVPSLTPIPTANPTATAAAEFFTVESATLQSDYPAGVYYIFKGSSRRSLNCSAKVLPVAPSISCAVTRTRFPALRTLPSTT